jgi:hypothetical protein
MAGTSASGRGGIGREKFALVELLLRRKHPKAAIARTVGVSRQVVVDISQGRHCLQRRAG